MTLGVAAGIRGRMHGWTLVSHERPTVDYSQPLMWWLVKRSWLSGHPAEAWAIPDGNLHEGVLEGDTEIFRLQFLLLC